MLARGVNSVFMSREVGYAIVFREELSLYKMEVQSSLQIFAKPCAIFLLVSH